MLRCFILFKRCRTCRSQSRCWTCGRRGTFSTSWGWRARSKGCGQSSDRSNLTGRRSSTKTFRYSFLFDVELWKELHREKAAKLSPSKDIQEASELINFHSRMRSFRVYRHPAEDGTVWHGVSKLEWGDPIVTWSISIICLLTTRNNEFFYSSDRRQLYAKITLNSIELSRVAFTCIISAVMWSYGCLFLSTTWFFRLAETDSGIRIESTVNRTTQSNTLAGIFSIVIHRGEHRGEERFPHNDTDVAQQ